MIPSETQTMAVISESTFAQLSHWSRASVLLWYTHTQVTHVCFLTEKLSKVIMSYFRPDLNFDTASEKELEVSQWVATLSAIVCVLSDMSLKLLSPFVSLGVHVDKKLLGWGSRKKAWL